MRFGTDTYSFQDLAYSQNLLDNDDKNMWLLSSLKQSQKLHEYHILIFLFLLHSMPLPSACLIPNFPNKNLLLKPYSTSYISSSVIVYHCNPSIHPLKITLL